MAASVASRAARCTELHRSSGAGGSQSPVDELMTLQGVYRKCFGTLPPNLEANATVDALRAICELDLSYLESVEPPRGFWRD